MAAWSGTSRVLLQLGVVLEIRSCQGNVNGSPECQFLGPPICLLLVLLPTCFQSRVEWLQQRQQLGNYVLRIIQLPWVWAPEHLYGISCQGTGNNWLELLDERENLRVFFSLFLSLMFFRLFYFSSLAIYSNEQHAMH